MIGDVIGDIEAPKIAVDRLPLDGGDGLFFAEVEEESRSSAPSSAPPNRDVASADDPADPAMNAVESTSRNDEADVAVSGNFSYPEKIKVSDPSSLEQSACSIVVADDTVDEFATKESDPAPINSNSSCNWMNGFEIGDMVWGKVKSHPWWPGHLFDEAFATTSVRKSKREGHVLVAFFGDSSYGWFDPAELIPFEPHYAEKSKQTTSKNFIKAVEEAVDEASRRSALGVSCHCYNPLKIHPTSVPGYVSVDVPGYEPGGIYSLKRIEEAREAFVPSAALSFLRLAAETPLDKELWSMEGVKQRGILLAIRRAMFEDFDRAKVEASGEDDLGGALDAQEQPGRVTSRAPLSGPMVIAEPLAEREAAAPSTMVKKNKTLTKRREESPTPGGGEGGSVDFVVQNQAPLEEQPPPLAVDEKAAAAAAAALAEAHQRMMSLASAQTPPRDGGGSGGGGGEETVKKIKKKRKREPGLGPPPLAPKRIQKDAAPPAMLEPAATVPLPKPDLSAVDGDLAAALSELTALAVDPFYGADGSADVRHVFLLFRSLVFEKGLPFPLPKEYEPFLLRRVRPSQEAAERRAVPSPKHRQPGPPLSRADDPTKAGRKRAVSSDRPDEKTPKKPKKLSAKVPVKAPVVEPPAPLPKPKPKQKQKAEPKTEAPTFLVMKFPQRSTLPSISSLKARFARFGPLDLSGTRVFWKSYTCKVLFKHKLDAQAAMAYAQSNDVFGQIRVVYSIRDPDQLADVPLPLPKRLDPAAPPPKTPKSILKKPSEDGAAAAKETQRVKFLIAVAEPQPPRRPSADVDFSRQMLSLLTRCCDIVADVKSALGYVPYHPL
ncbi:tudor/PWWP/MBT superfamily protein isoform X2 [Wolffia australiana]